MAATPEQDGRKARMVAVVLIVTMILWLGLQAVGGAAGWNVRYAILLDLAALAAFIWALVVTYQIWRTRRGSRG
jgi:spore maturation protein SpmA